MMSSPHPERPVELQESSLAEVDAPPRPSESDIVPESADGTTRHFESRPMAANSSHEVEAKPHMPFPFDENVFGSAPPQPENASEEVPYLQPTAAAELIHPPDFKPFFTLIEDPETGVYHHPSVHYIFSDDDPNILTAAVLDTFDEARDGGLDPGHASDPPPQRSVIVDVAADGRKITSVASLSAEWQGLETSVGPAPSWGNDSIGADGGLMLRISGQRSIEASGSVEGIRHPRQYASVEEMLEVFSRRLAWLDSALKTD